MFWKQRGPIVLVSLAILVAAVPAWSQSAQRAQLAQEAADRAKVAADKGDWATAAREAVMAATLAPSRSHDWMAAATLVAQNAWSGAVVWIEAAQGKPATMAEDAASALWMQKIRGRQSDVTKMLGSCPRNLSQRQVEVLAATILERPATPAELQWKCVRLRLPAISVAPRVLQDGKEVAATDAAYLVHTGVVEVLVGDQPPVSLRIDGENNADLLATMSPDLPALRGRLTLRGLAKHAEVLVDGAVQSVGADGQLTVEALRPHKLLVRAAGRVDWYKQVTLGLAERQSIDVRLTKQAPWTPMLVAGGGALLAAAGGLVWTLGGDAPMTATRDPDTGRINNIGLAERQAQVDSANLMRGVGVSTAGLGVMAVAVGLVWRLITNLEPDEWRNGQLVHIPNGGEALAKDVQP